VATRVALEALGDLRGGYPAKSPVRAREMAGWIPALQASDVRPDGSVAWEELSWAEADPVPEKYVVADGDVLMPLRGSTPRALTLHGVPRTVLVVGHWMMLSPDRETVEPDYLSWYLNQPRTAARLGGMQRGSKLKFLSLTSLRDFEVDLPPLIVQRRIARADSTDRRVAVLEDQLAETRRQLVDGLTMAALRRSMNTESEEV
jgi:hypothetical protein